MTESIFARLDVPPVINASGIYTDLGGSRLSPTVWAAMTEANEHFIDMVELLARSGEVIADLIGVEAARVTPGASAALSAVLTTILPFLRVFDAKEYTVFSPIAVAGTPFAADPKAITVLALWGFVAVAAMYAVAYVTFALSAGMLLFQNRELGGAEG